MNRISKLIFAVLILLVGSSIFGAIAEDIINNEPQWAIDNSAAQWLRGHPSSALTRLMEIVTEIGNPYWVMIVTAVFSVVLLRNSKTGWFTALVLTIPCGILLNACLKFMFRRARPEMNPRITGYSFPSAHTMAATLMYGFLAAYVFHSSRNTRLRVAAILFASVLILVTAISRVYIYAHYPTDVIAGIAAGLVWLVLCISAVVPEVWRRRS